MSRAIIRSQKRVAIDAHAQQLKTLRAMLALMQLQRPVHINLNTRVSAVTVDHDLHTSTSEAWSKAMVICCSYSLKIQMFLGE